MNKKILLFLIGISTSLSVSCTKKTLLILPRLEFPEFQYDVFKLEDGEEEKSSTREIKWFVKMETEEDVKEFFSAIASDTSDTAEYTITKICTYETLEESSPEKYDAILFRTPVGSHTKLIPFARFLKPKGSIVTLSSYLFAPDKSIQRDLEKKEFTQESESDIEITPTLRFYKQVFTRIRT